MQAQDSMTGVLEYVLKPELLTDTSRLQEIYDLRVSAWENSEKKGFINREMFPNGWSDKLDKEAHHFVITNAHDQIIAAARLNIFSSLDTAPYGDLIKNMNASNKGPFGYLGRLVIHPQYQQQNLSSKLIAARVNYCEANKISWLQALVTSERVKNILTRLDFKVKGQIEVNYHEFTPSHAVNVFVKEYDYKD